VLGGLADVERDLIRTRTAEGRSRAQKRGQRMGRKPKFTEAQQDEAASGVRKVPRLPNSRAALRSKSTFRSHGHDHLKGSRNKYEVGNADTVKCRRP
jgi:DNA invertase Pin-like site-specific DNA recombinase